MVTDFRGGTVLENKVQDMIKEMGGRRAVLGNVLFCFTFLLRTKAEGI